MRNLLFFYNQPTLNIGPGLANLEAILPEPQEKIVLDLKTTYLTSSRGIPNAHHINAVAEALPFRTASLPTITTQSTFQVMTNQKDFMRELARVLTKDGKFIITIEYAANYQPHRQTFTNDKTPDLVLFLYALGLTVDEIVCLTYEGKWTYTLSDGFSMWIFGRKD